uniref:SWIM-type domain-containing protein n=1 Tax=Anguilla anguilla TaxID=7936 RepID=A0A0E9R3G0_ANGAN
MCIHRKCACSGKVRNTLKCKTIIQILINTGVVGSISQICTK